MHVFAISVVLRTGSTLRYAGLFADGFEACLQAEADFPDARRVSAICLRRYPS